MLTQAVFLGATLIGAGVQSPPRKDYSASYVSSLNEMATSRIFSESEQGVLISRVDATGVALLASRPEDVVEESAQALQALAIVPGDSRADDAIDELLIRLMQPEEAQPLPLVE